MSSIGSRLQLLEPLTPLSLRTPRTSYPKRFGKVHWLLSSVVVRKVDASNIDLECSSLLKSWGIYCTTYIEEVWAFALNLNYIGLNRS
ncbi:hypothetical protein TWF970_009286 [Orbilia oligospora]|uniref:Uncharacterized protein n=1 Tax=Orbilia oligospora TaxID=2813651 RepID=A0A7C8VBV8_ORBOL|nr:hypothetical protein TWF970_009286 [Orbilia oligospora]